MFFFTFCQTENFPPIQDFNEIPTMVPQVSPDCSLAKVAKFAEISDFRVFRSASDNKWTVSERVTGLPLSRLDRLSMIFMKNKKFQKKTFLKNIFFEI